MTAGVYGTAVAWSDEHVTTLRQLWLEGYSARLIGEKLGRSRNSIIGRVHRLDLAKRLSTIGPRRKPGPKKGNPGTFRKSRAKPSKPPAIRIVRVKPPRPQAVPPPEARMVSLMELTPSECKWPIGTPGEAGFGFCGMPLWLGRPPYCEYHNRLAYVPVMMRKADREAWKQATRLAA